MAYSCSCCTICFILFCYKLNRRKARRLVLVGDAEGDGEGANVVDTEGSDVGLCVGAVVGATLGK